MLRAARIGSEPLGIHSMRFGRKAFGDFRIRHGTLRRRHHRALKSADEDARPRRMAPLRHLRDPGEQLLPQLRRRGLDRIERAECGGEGGEVRDETLIARDLGSVAVLRLRAAPLQLLPGTRQPLLRLALKPREELGDHEAAPGKGRPQRRGSEHLTLGACGARFRVWLPLQERDAILRRRRCRQKRADRAVVALDRFPTEVGIGTPVAPGHALDVVGLDRMRRDRPLGEALAALVRVGSGQPAEGMVDVWRILRRVALLRRRLALGNVDHPGRFPAAILSVYGPKPLLIEVGEEQQAAVARQGRRAVERRQVLAIDLGEEMQGGALLRIARPGQLRGQAGTSAEPALAAPGRANGPAAAQEDGRLGLRLDHVCDLRLGQVAGLVEGRARGRLGCAAIRLGSGPRRPDLEGAQAAQEADQRGIESQGQRIAKAAVFQGAADRHKPALVPERQLCKAAEIVSLEAAELERHGDVACHDLPRTALVGEAGKGPLRHRAPRAKVQGVEEAARAGHRDQRQGPAENEAAQRSPDGCHQGGDTRERRRWRSRPSQQREVGRRRLPQRRDPQDRAQHVFSPHRSAQPASRLAVHRTKIDDQPGESFLFLRVCRIEAQPIVRRDPTCGAAQPPPEQGVVPEPEPEAQPQQAAQRPAAEDPVPGLAQGLDEQDEEREVEESQADRAEEAQAPIGARGHEEGNGQNGIDHARSPGRRAIPRIARP